MTSPTTRETADHAELLAGKACGDRMLAVAEALMPWLKNYPPSTRRERAIEAANAAIAASCSPLLSEIAALRGEAERVEADRIRTVDHRMTLTRRALEAERQRDELRKAVRRAMTFAGLCVDAGEVQPDDAENPADLWDALNAAFLANQGADQ